MGELRNETLSELQDEVDLWRMIFDSAYEGTLITDADGYIMEINRPYCDFLGITPDDVIGKHCTELLDSTRLHIVGQTGKPEINQIQIIQGHNILVRRVPIKKNGEIVAAVGHVMFNDIKQVHSLARKFSELESKVRHYEQELREIRSTRYSFESIIGENQEMQRMKKEALVATSNTFPVLITGESGTGKELFAQAIHQASARNLHPFIRINCSAIPRELIESELFGYEKGAFTGAKAGGKPGKFELANKGTIFLDEIGEMPLDMQPKLLRVLEEKEFERVGGTKTLRSDFRLIAATNRNLEEMTRQGTFRQDLYYRINVIHLHIPPLRERRDDIGILSRTLLNRIAQAEGLSGVDLQPEAEKALAAYPWPGNVRELANILERTIASLENQTISLLDLPYTIRKAFEGDGGYAPSPLKDALVAAERKIILATLEHAAYNKAKAARILGIHRTLLYKKMRKYSIPCDPEQNLPCSA